MEKFEQRESKRGYRTGKTWRSSSKENQGGYRYRTGKTYKKFEQRESKRGTGQAYMEKFEQRESKRGTAEAEHGEV